MGKFNIKMGADCSNYCSSTESRTLELNDTQNADPKSTSFANSMSETKF